MATKRGFFDILIFVVIGLLFVSVGVYFLVRPNKAVGEDKKFVKEFKEMPKASPENENQKNGGETKDISGGSGGSSGGGSGGGSGGSSGGGSGGGTTCSEEQIPYSLIFNYQESNCSQYDGEICIEKWVNCSTSIKNGDTSTSGNFSVKMVFLERGGDKNADGFDKQNYLHYLLPGKDKEMIASTIVTSTGENGIANKEINCFYYTLEVPKKKVCN